MSHRKIDAAIDGLGAVNLDQLGRDLHAAWQTKADNPSHPDGHKRQTFGASPATGGGNGPTVEDEHGRRVAVELTRVEAHAIAPHRIDEYDKLVFAALNYLEDAERALRASHNKLAQIGRLQEGGGLQPSEQGCWALDRIGSWDAPHRQTVIDGEPRTLGRWAYEFHRSNGRLPTIDECKRHVRGSKVFVKAS